MDKNKAKINQIAKIIKESKTFFIAGHQKPDGDSIGSALALASVLKNLGKKVTVASGDDIPPFLMFLPGAKDIKKSLPSSAKYDCAIILECLDFSRMGNLITPAQAKKIINIDHHSMFTDFGTVNFIVPSSASTAELILSIFEHMKIKLSKAEAECLYVGILTDTGRFQQLNTTQNSHIAAAKLMALGVSPDSIKKKVYDTSSLAAVKFLGLAISLIQTDFNGQFAYIVLTKEMFKKSGVKDGELESLVNWTVSIEGVKVGALFKEISKNETKASFRSVEGVDILSIVQTCGGGGHKNAAGCTLNSDINTAVQTIKNVFTEKFGDPKFSKIR